MTPIKALVALIAAVLAFGVAPASVRAQAETSRAQALDAAIAEIGAAEEALRQAQERQQQAVEPLPGERLANVGMGSRLAPAYFERQREAAAEVDKARARLDEAYRRWNELRE